MPNIQIYCVKRSFDVQKAERFFKERRIPFQSVDMRRHVPGRRELDLFARATGGMSALLDRESTKVLSHPAAYMRDENAIAQEIMEDPSLLRAPIVRNGQKVTIGVHEDIWTQWLES